MTEAHEFTLRQLVDYATFSSSELGDLGGGNLIDYESGKTYYFDAETATFLASARSIVLELARRLRESELKISYGAFCKSCALSGEKPDSYEVWLETMRKLGHA
jgi:hypothetical protein